MAARSGSGSRRTPWSAALLGIPSLVAAYLGNWQLERRQWKMRLLEERREQLLAEPIDLFAVDELPPEYSRVTLTGTYDHAKAAFVGPRGRPSSAGVTEQVGVAAGCPMAGARRECGRCLRHGQARPSPCELYPYSPPKRRRATWSSRRSPAQTASARRW